MGFDAYGKPDYKTWLEMKEGNNPYQSLLDDAKRSVDNMYKGVTCPQCGMMGTSVSDHIMKCEGCGTCWSIYS